MDKIICPSCGTEIDITESLIAPALESQKAELKKEHTKQLQTLRSKNEELEAAKKELDKEKLNLEDEIKQRLDKEKIKLAQEQKVIFDKEKESILKQIQNKEQELQAAKKVELELLKERENLEKQKADLDLTVARKISEERNRIKLEAVTQHEEEVKLVMADKDKKLSDLTKQIDELKRKSEQGSQQAQGEIFELVLQDELKQAFLYDAIEEVPKGINGADCIQRVKDGTGIEIGAILWECKRTKSWNDEWLTKLKEDQRQVKADLAVIVSFAMPKDVLTFKEINGIWVVSPKLSLELAAALRCGLLEVGQLKKSLVNQSGKMEIMYNYITGSDFKRRVEGIIEPFTTMREDLEKEKRAISKIWAQREQQISRVIQSVGGMYGDLQGIIGEKIPGIALLDFDSEEN